MTIAERLARLEAKQHRSGGFVATFRDGSHQTVRAGEAVQLVYDRLDDLDGFMEQPGGRNGSLERLLNGLIRE